MLYAVAAYYERNVSVSKLCEHIGIAVSTLYAWKKRLIEHMELLSGLLDSVAVSVLSSVRRLIASPALFTETHRFFRQCGFSFMQRRSPKTSWSRPP